MINVLFETCNSIIEILPDLILFLLLSDFDYVYKSYNTFDSYNIAKSLRVSNIRQAHQNIIKTNCEKNTFPHIPKATCGIEHRIYGRTTTMERRQLIFIFETPFFRKSTSFPSDNSMVHLTREKNRRHYSSPLR